MKRKVDLMWVGVKAAWNDGFALFMLALMALGYMAWMPALMAVLATLSVVFIGAALYARGIVQGIETTRKIYEGTTDEPEQPTTRRDWTEDEL